MRPEWLRLRRSINARSGQRSRRLANGKRKIAPSLVPTARQGPRLVSIRRQAATCRERMRDSRRAQRKPSIGSSMIIAPRRTRTDPRRPAPTHPGEHVRHGENRLRQCACGAGNERATSVRLVLLDAARQRLLALAREPGAARVMRSTTIPSPALSRGETQREWAPEPQFARACSEAETPEKFDIISANIFSEI